MMFFRLFYNAQFNFDFNEFFSEKFFSSILEMEFCYDIFKGLLNCVTGLIDIFRVGASETF